MNTLLFFLLAAFQQEPSKAPLPETGKVLLLENERILEGDIEKVGARYRIKRTIGETWVPAKSAMILCASLDDAFRFLRSRANLEDPDERLRLVGWSVRNGLRERAVEEAGALCELRPDHEPSKKLLLHLQASLEQEIARKNLPSDPAESEPLPTLPFEVANESLSVFSTRVQPILMNTCASCHAVNKGGNFKLHRVYQVGQANRKNMQHNLAAVLSQVNIQQPENSQFLAKALTIHGGGSKPPLAGRDSEAFKTLEGWVRLTAQRSASGATNPVPGKPAFPASEESKKMGEFATAGKEEAKDKEKSKMPVKETENPYDPEYFNRLFNPGKSPAKDK
ncbi:MAG: hypothetical protein EXR99_15790 [Gemmataceae bacterium]|nr:hypothetical protein [Gemmataceae bacterium]